MAVRTFIHEGRKGREIAPSRRVVAGTPMRASARHKSDTVTVAASRPAQSWYRTGKGDRMAEEIKIDPAIPPSGEGCVECLATDGWWFHLRRCARCGHVGCCDSSPSQHASRHAASERHPVVQSFEPEEDWFWDYAT